jgi:hypothetical protein
VIEGGYTLIASRAALAQGLGAGNKGYDMPPPAALDDTAPAAARQPHHRRSGRVPTNSWVREIYDPGEYTGSVAAPKPEAKPDPAPGAREWRSRNQRRRRCDQAGDDGRRTRGVGKPAATPPGAGDAIA